MSISSGPTLHSDAGSPFILEKRHIPTGRVSLQPCSQSGHLSNDPHNCSRPGGGRVEAIIPHHFRCPSTRSRSRSLAMHECKLRCWCARRTVPPSDHFESRELLFDGRLRGLANPGWCLFRAYRSLALQSTLRSSRRTFNRVLIALRLPKAMPPVCCTTPHPKRIRRCADRVNRFCTLSNVGHSTFGRRLSMTEQTLQTLLEICHLPPKFALLLLGDSDHSAPGGCSMIDAEGIETMGKSDDRPTTCPGSRFWTTYSPLNRLFLCSSSLDRSKSRHPDERLHAI